MSGGRGSTPCRLVFDDLLFLALARRLPVLVSEDSIALAERLAGALACGWMQLVPVDA